MKVYLAARYSRREELCEVRAELHEAGAIVTSRWLDGNHQIPTGEEDTNGAQARQFAVEDLHDVLAADMVVAFTEMPRTTTSRGGRHVELGIALGAGKLTVVVGPRENVFCWLPNVRHFGDWNDAAFHVLGRAGHEADCQFWPESGWSCSAAHDDIRWPLKPVPVTTVSMSTSQGGANNEHH